MSLRVVQGRSRVLRQVKKDVLVTEDEPSLRFSIALALERARLTLDVAEDGAQAIQMLDLNAYGSVVLDLRIPKVDGYGVVAYIKEHHHGTPVIIVTGLQPDELSGMDTSVVKNILFKPLDMEKLVSQVTALCRPK
jgi:DNA-binding response OmpR family regulator